MNEDNKEKECCCGGHDHECCGGHDHDHDCDCGCGETVTIAFDDGEEMTCNVLGVFDALEREYIALLPIDAEDVLLFRHVEGEEGSELAPIEDDAEYDAVVKVFEEMFEDEEEE